MRTCAAPRATATFLRRTSPPRCLHWAAAWSTSSFTTALRRFAPPVLRHCVTVLAAHSLPARRCCRRRQRRKWFIRFSSPPPPSATARRWSREPSTITTARYVNACKFLPVPSFLSHMSLFAIAATALVRASSQPLMICCCMSFSANEKKNVFAILICTRPTKVSYKLSIQNTEELIVCGSSVDLRQQSVQLVDLLKYSGQSDNTAAQKIYNTNSTPRYMQAVRNQCDRSPPAMAPDCHDSTRAALMADLMSPLSGLYRRVVILITICSGRPPTFTTK